VVSKAIRNPVFFGDVSVPLLRAMDEGQSSVRVVITTRDGAGAEIEMEVRIGTTRVTREMRRKHQRVAKAAKQ
jgi:hypothetical protein